MRVAGIKKNQSKFDKNGKQRSRKKKKCGCVRRRAIAKAMFESLNAYFRVVLIDARRRIEKKKPHSNYLNIFTYHYRHYYLLLLPLVCSFLPLLFRIFAFRFAPFGCRLLLLLVLRNSRTLLQIELCYKNCRVRIEESSNRESKKSLEQQRIVCACVQSKGRKINLKICRLC